MGEELQTSHDQLYNHTQLSLHRYHLSIVNLLDAIMQRKSNDQLLLSNIHTTLTGIRGSILAIQTIHQKKFELEPNAEVLRNMIGYRIILGYGFPKIIIEEDSPLPPWKSNL